jgi:hypothetical protein
VGGQIQYYGPFARYDPSALSILDTFCRATARRSGRLYSTFPNRDLLAPRFHAGLIPSAYTYAASILTMTALRVAADFVGGTDTRLTLLRRAAGWPQRQYASSTFTMSPASSSMAGRVLWAAQVCRVLMVQQGFPHADVDIPVFYSPPDQATPPTTAWCQSQITGSRVCTAYVNEVSSQWYTASDLSEMTKAD